MRSDSLRVRCWVIAMTKYFLPQHVYAACRGDAVIFLDLRNDDYLMITGEAAAAFRQLSQQSCMPLDRSLTELVDNGLLTTDQSSGKDVATTHIDLALEHLSTSDVGAEVRITLRHFWRFTAACTIAAWRLMWQRLEKTIHCVEQRKRTRGSLRAFDVERARELVAVFHALRLLFPVNYLCLYDSLALVEFLASYDVFPTWVFGVKLEPWAAHCWVQEAGITFNEEVEQAATFTAIMAI
jgi:hypothetical protein